jgi:hypothetical protein
MTVDPRRPIAHRSVSESVLLWRTRARWFAAEFLVIVTGVLVALALNALYERREDGRNERAYLALLERDLGHTTQQLNEKIAFEAGQLRDGLSAYRALSGGPVAPENRAAVSASLSNLVDRRTMILRDATYQDLISTGNLRLIRDRRLRDEIVGYYSATYGEFDVMNRNNAVVVDGLYNSLMIARGLVMPAAGRANLALLSDANAALAGLLRDGFVNDADYLWRLPADGPEWAAVKTVLVSRIRIAWLSERSAQQALTRTGTLMESLRAARQD